MAARVGRIGSTAGCHCSIIERVTGFSIGLVMGSHFLLRHLLVAHLSSDPLREHRAWLAYPLLILPVALVAIFPGLFSAVLTRLVSRFGSAALFVAPLSWPPLEWARYTVTGQVWNALGYSQAFHPMLIQPARWGGVYAISFLILTTNVALAFIFLR